MLGMTADLGVISRAMIKYTKCGGEDLCWSCVAQFAWTLGELRHREVLWNGDGVKGEVSNAFLQQLVHASFPFLKLSSQFMGLHH